MNIEEINVENTGIDKALYGNKVVWENNRLPEIRYSWYLSNTYEFVEMVGYSKGDKVYAMKDDFVTNNSVGFLVYEYSNDFPYLGFRIKHLDQWVPVSSYNVEIKEGIFLHFSETIDSNISLSNIKNRAFSIDAPFYYLNDIKMYYFEFGRQISGSKKIGLMNKMAANWKLYKNK